MRRLFMTKQQLVWLLLFAGPGLLIGCRSAPQWEEKMAPYFAALEATDGSVRPLVERGSPEEAAALQLFKDVFLQFDEAALRQGITNLYAESVYFHDTLVELHTAAEVEAYFLRSLEAAAECTFDIVDIAENDGNYYIRWTMTLVLNRYPNDPPNISKGMTHLRFDENGQIIFHQDYWDTAHLYQQLPVVGGLIRWVNRQIEKP